MDGLTMSMRELSVLETNQVGGAFSWWDFGSHVFVGAVTGGLAGSVAPGLGTGLGALGGGLIGGIDYSLHQFLDVWC